MTTNPEFLRNLWLELTPHRIIGMPAALAALFFLLYLIAGIDYLSTISTGSMTVFFLLTLLWGTRLAGETLVNEVQDKTWDQQRMSSIAPWSMSWGKLFGSTVFAWYGALICLIVYIFTAFQSGESDVILTAVFMVLVSIFAQAIAMLTSLQSVRSFHRSASTGFMVAGILVSIPLLNIGFRDAGSVQWYDNNYRTFYFLLIAVMCFTGWSLLGIYRKIREELQFRNTPVYWFSFCIFLAFFLAGLARTSTFGDSVITARLMIAYVTFIVLAYAMVIADEKNPILVKRIIAAIKLRNWKTVFENTPTWLATLAGIYMICFALLLHSSSLQHVFPKIVEIKSMAVAVALFVTRDILVFVFFNLSTNRRRADVTAVFYLLIFYWLVPSILSGLNLNTLNAVFWPIGPHNEMASIAAGVVQVAILGYLSIRRWNTLYIR